MRTAVVLSHWGERAVRQAPSPDERQVEPRGSARHSGRARRSPRCSMMMSRHLRRPLGPEQDAVIFLRLRWYRRWCPRRDAPPGRWMPIHKARRICLRPPSLGRLRMRSCRRSLPSTRPPSRTHRLVRHRVFGRQEWTRWRPHMCPQMGQNIQALALRLRLPLHPLRPPNLRRLPLLSHLRLPQWLRRPGSPQAGRV